MIYDTMNPILPRKVKGIMADRKYKPNPKKQAYDYNYELEHYDRIVVKANKGTKDQIKQVAEESGVSMNVWLCNLINNELNK